MRLVKVAKPMKPARAVEAWFVEKGRLKAAEANLGACYGYQKDEATHREHIRYYLEALARYEKAISNLKDSVARVSEGETEVL